jgi:hypothetical protein
VCPSSWLPLIIDPQVILFGRIEQFHGSTLAITPVETGKVADPSIHKCRGFHAVTLFLRHISV